MDDVLRWYRRWGSESPERAALVSGPSTVTYGILGDRVADGAGRFRFARPPLAPGSRVRLALPPTTDEWIVGLLAILAAGHQAVLPAPEWSPVEEDAARANLPVAASLEAGANGRWAVLAGDGPTPTGVEETGVWLFTSGTTSVPQPRFRSSASLATMIERLQLRLPAEATEDPRSLCLLLLHHGYGLLNAVLLQHALGGAVHLHSADDPDGAWRVMAEQEIGVLYGRPLHFEQLAAVGGHGPGPKGADDGGPLRWCVSSSSPLDPEVARGFERRAGCRIRQQYGTTETGPLALDLDADPQAGCVGTALHGVDLRITDRDGRPVPNGVEGLVGARLVNGTNPELDTGPGGLFYPGDRGRQDGDGRVFLTGRTQPFFDERAET